MVRLAAAYTDETFERAVAKYVRANHVQTEPDFRRSWKKATVVEGAGAGWRSPLGYEQGREVGGAVGGAAAGVAADGEEARAVAKGGKGKGRGQPRGRGRGRGRRGAAGDAHVTAGDDGAAAAGGATWQEWRVRAACVPAGLMLPALPPALTPREELKAVYRGPTKRSNWVVPGRVLAGDRSSVDKPASLEELIRLGVDTFVCLQVRDAR